MPLDKAFLKRRLKGLQDSLAARTDNPEAARQQYADEFVDMLYDFLVGGDVVGTASTTGTAAAQTGPIKGKLQ